MRFLKHITIFCLITFVGMNAHAGKKEDTMVVEKGKIVAIDYTLTVDGQVVDSSKGKKPLEYTHGSGQIIPGLSKELEGMKEGDEKTVEVAPKDGYGETDPKAFQEIPKTKFPEDMELKIGAELQARNNDGSVIPLKISEIKDETVIVDFNHPLAGKALNFEVKIISIK